MSMTVTQVDVNTLSRKRILAIFKRNNYPLKQFAIDYEVGHSAVSMVLSKGAPSRPMMEFARQKALEFLAQEKIHGISRRRA